MTVVAVHASVAIAVPGVTLADALPVHSAVTGAGHAMFGGVVSTTVMLLSQDDEWSDSSVATYVVVVVPNGYTPGLGPVTFVAEQASVAVAAFGVTLAEAFPVHSTATFAGHMMLGGVVSSTTIFAVHDTEFPEPSVAV